MGTYHNRTCPYPDTLSTAGHAQDPVTLPAKGGAFKKSKHGSPAPFGETGVAVPPKRPHKHKDPTKHVWNPPSRALGTRTWDPSASKPIDQQGRVPGLQRLAMYAWPRSGSLRSSSSDLTAQRKIWGPNEAKEIVRLLETLKKDIS